MEPFFCVLLIHLMKGTIRVPSIMVSVKAQIHLGIFSGREIDVGKQKVSEVPTRGTKPEGSCRQPFLPSSLPLALTQRLFPPVRATGFSDSWCGTIFSVCLHSACPSAQADESLTSPHSVTIGDCCTGERPRMQRCSQALAPDIIGRGSDGSCPARTAASLLTVKAHSGLHRSTATTKSTSRARSLLLNMLSGFLSK
ncbi:hypothetical protein EYF80_010117 [Liparis tanakae]|uniref:Uncharacterized protein n=1 Tax=Liparis tanakae TaxID=230148 RepID=A0A4Z2INR4_9TELE|nr:hypothetical protein EYF80_010117 [Liparis tanakae]